MAKLVSLAEGVADLVRDELQERLGRPGTRMLDRLRQAQTEDGRVDAEDRPRPLPDQVPDNAASRLSAESLPLDRQRSRLRHNHSSHNGPGFDGRLTPGRRGHATSSRRCKVERFHRTLADEWAYAKAYSSEAARRAALPAWLHAYNHHRAHTALGGLPPASRVPNLPGQNT